MSSRTRRYLISVLVIEAILLVLLFGVAIIFWSSVCEGTKGICHVAEGLFGLPTYFGLAMLRPFVFTPFMFLSFLGGEAFGPIIGTVVAIAGALLSADLVHRLALRIARLYTLGWLAANMPRTWTLLKNRAFFIVFFMRLFPFLPFDLATVVFAAGHFSRRAILWGTVLGALPEAYLLASLGSDEPFSGATIFHPAVCYAVALVVPTLLLELRARLWTRRSFAANVHAGYREAIHELRMHNEITRRTVLGPERVPILLLYGFFSSRRALAILEKQLTRKGYSVFSFNLGGWFDIFFTRDIVESADFVDYKIKRQIRRHGIRKVHVVAHSKGGLVAMWWLLFLGGNKYVDKVITMGTPFRGSRYVYVAMVTPLALIWRSVWQMRPGSSMLKTLNAASVPEGLDIFCFHSKIDNVAPGRGGIFQNQRKLRSVHAVPMNTVSHFGFLYRKDVIERIAAILGDGLIPPPLTESSAVAQAPGAAEYGKATTRELAASHDSRSSEAANGTTIAAVEIGGGSAPEGA